MRRLRLFEWFLILALMLPACGQSPAGSAPGGGLRVVATTTIVGDIVRNVGGGLIDLTVLLPPGVDTHSYEPAPQDIAKVADAAVVFANGAGLEAFLQRLVTNAGGKAKLVSLAEGIPLQKSQDVDPGEALQAGDPHLWFDPNNVLVWTQTIAGQLGELDPAHLQQYRDNARRYQNELHGLDTWIQQQVGQVPAENRQLVTDHAVFTYFATRYGFQQTGAIIPGYSSMSQPSAQELAHLEDTIRRLQVKAIFVGKTVNPALGERIAQDTGVRLVPIYTESLTAASGPAATYLDFMRYDVGEIVKALK